jgi:SAM-dependent methyltransferase
MVRDRQQRIIVTGQWVFDNPTSQEFNRARQDFLGQLLPELRRQIGLASAADVGCGIGYFCKFLTGMGFHVVGFEGREQNAIEARRRYPEITFLTKNVEDPDFPNVGKFDLVLCAGLLYHLENPFRAIRNLHSLTGKVLLVESMCAPGIEPSLQLLDEYRSEDQGLNYIAFYPTETCLVKMLYLAGFSYVYGPTILPDSADFRESASRRRERTIVAACVEPVTLEQLKLLPEPTRSWDIWSVPLRPWRTPLGRIAAIARRLVPGRNGSKGHRGAKG